MWTLFDAQRVQNPIELPTAERLGKNLLERGSAGADPAACNPGPDSETDALIRAQQETLND